MNAIEKIIAQMNEQANKEQAELEQKEKEKIDLDYQNNLAQINSDFEKQKTKQLAAIDSKYRQMRNRQQVEIRQETLNEKQQFLAKLFQQAAEQMEAWNQEEVCKFAEGNLKVMPLDESKTVYFIPGEKSKDYFSPAWLEQINASLAYDLLYSDQVVAGQSGFIVDDQGVQYNFIFQNLVKDIQETLAYEIANQLFE